MTDTPLGAVRELTRAWVAKDAAAMSARLSDDIVEIGPAFDQPLSGQKHFLRMYKAYLEGPLRVASYRIVRPRTVFLTATVAQVYFHYRMRTETAGTIEDSGGKESMLVVCRGKRWRVRFIHWHRDR